MLKKEKIKCRINAHNWFFHKLKIMNIKKTTLIVLTFFALFIGYNCAPVVYKAGLSFGPSEAKWVSLQKPNGSARL